MVSRCVASSSAVLISGDGERRVDSADRSIDWLYFVVIQSLVSADSISIARIYVSLDVIYIHSRTNPCASFR
jgi:hypothetical protein